MFPVLFLVLIKAVQWYRYENNGNSASQFPTNSLLQINQGICFLVVAQFHLFLSGVKAMQSAPFSLITALHFSFGEIKN